MANIKEQLDIAYARVEAARMRLDEAITEWGEDPTDKKDIALTVCDYELECECQNREEARDRFYNWRAYR